MGLVAPMDPDLDPDELTELGMMMLAERRVGEARTHIKLTPMPCVAACCACVPLHLMMCPWSLRLTTLPCR